MFRRVSWTAAVLVLLAAAGWGITIPIGNASGGVHSLSTGISNSTLSPVPAGPNEDSWYFYYSGSVQTAYVVRSDRAPISSGIWQNNDTYSRWISPTGQNYAGNGSGCCTLPASSLTTYLAALTFTVPNMTNPPNLPQWFLVMSGQVWGDNIVSGYSLYAGASPTGTPIVSATFTTPPGPLTPQLFSIHTLVNPGQQYTLAFLLSNAANTVTGFRLQMTEAYVTPEPGSWAFMLSVGAGLAFLRWRRRAR